MDYVLLYISIPTNLRRNVFGSSNISFYIRRTHLPYSPSPSESDSSPPISFLPSMATCPSLTPIIYRVGCSHRLLYRRIPGFSSTAKHKSMIGRVAIYCATVFWRRAIYTPISSSPTIPSAAPMVGYTHVPSG